MTERSWKFSFISGDIFQYWVVMCCGKLIWFSFDIFLTAPRWFATSRIYDLRYIFALRYNVMCRHFVSIYVMFCCFWIKLCMQLKKNCFFLPFFTHSIYIQYLHKVEENEKSIFHFMLLSWVRSRSKLQGRVCFSVEMFSLHSNQA